jgi:hypothetical protein
MTVHETLQQVGQMAHEVDAHCYASFDEDGTLNLEWISPNVRVGASFSDKEGAGWWYVRKEMQISGTHLGGPYETFDQRFLDALTLVELDERGHNKRRATNWWRWAFVGLALSNAAYLLRAFI